MSKGASTWSKGMEAFSRSNRGSWPALKRPPQGLPVPAAPAAPAAGAPVAVVVTCRRDAHYLTRCLRAYTSTGRPHSWMKPLADSWLKVSPGP